MYLKQKNLFQHGSQVRMIYQANHGISNTDIATLLDAYIEFMIIKALAQDIGPGETGGRMKYSAPGDVDIWHTNFSVYRTVSVFYEGFKQCESPS